MPSLCGAFTSARCRSSSRSFGRSIRSVASATSASERALSELADAAPASRTANTAIATARKPIAFTRGAVSESQQLIDFASAVGEGVHVDTDFFEQREMEICQRPRLGVLDVTGAFDRARTAAGDKDRQVHVIVHVGIAHSAAVQIDGMVQQAAVALGNGL